MRLESPVGDKKYNCLRVIFDGGITVIQKSRMSKGTFSVKFLVEPPSVKYDRTGERSAWVIEAKCLEIEGPEFDSQAPGDKIPGIEEAKTFLLAQLTPPVGFIKLDNLLRSNFNRSNLKENELLKEITQLIAGKARGDATTDAGVYLQQLGQVSMSELDFQKERILTQRGCRVTHSQQKEVLNLSYSHGQALI